MLVPILLIALALGLTALMLWQGHRQKAARFAALQNAWGKPRPQPETDPDALADIAEYWQALQKYGCEGPVVDTVTWNDLEMDALFAVLNRTGSTPGEEVLYAMLHRLGTPGETLAARSRVLAALENEPRRRTETIRLLRKLGKRRYHGANAYLFSPSVKRPEHLALYYLLAALPVVFLLLGLVKPIWLLGLAASFLVSALVYYLGGKRWMPAVTAIRHIAAVLNTAGKLADALPEALAPQREHLRALHAELSPVKRWNLLFAMQRQNEFDFLTDYLRIALQLDMIALGRLTAFFTRHGEALRALYETVGEIDALIAIAEYRAQAQKDGLAVCEPEFAQTRAVLAEGMRHPLTAAPVPNDFCWERCTLITGSNASGKSTFLKGMAVNLIFAQTLGLCTASRFRLPRCNVLTSMALRDDIRRSESYFVVEIKSLRRILAALNDALPTLCFIDEILRGTNTEERIAAASATLSYLAGQNGLCIAATHDYELIDLLPGFAQCHFQEEEGGDVKFTYRLLPGPSDSRNAIALLSRTGYPPVVIADAQAAIRRFHETGQWSTAKASKS